ncbi:serine/threonine protein kinase [Apiospora arundinis]
MSSGPSPLPPPTKTWNEHFVEYVTTVQKRGIDIDGKQSSYVSRDDLASYWDDDRLQSVLDSVHTAPIAADKFSIQQSYLRIWSCLVFIGHPDFILWFIKHNFTDDHIASAYDLIPSRANEDMAAQEMIRAFNEGHWKFWPVLFETDGKMYKRSLDARCVLPITYEGRLTPDAEYCKTIVSKVRIDESCCDFKEFYRKRWLSKCFNTITRITHPMKMKSTYSKSFPPSSSDVIVQYLGSFKQNQKCVVILELAPGGSLKDFLVKTRRPKSRQELRQLWGSLINLLNALLHLHNLAPGSRTIGCAHRDIKLENILVFPKSADSVYDFSLKLTDFDTSTNVQVFSSTSEGRQDHDGGRTYCAPEASRIHARNEREVLTVPLTSDVWSLGAVFSEVIVWLAEDFEGIEAFEQRRKEETKNLPGFRGSGFEACFHNGVDRLECVDEVLTQAMGLLLRLDNITPLIKRLTETYMLVKMEVRQDAKPLYQFFVNEMANLQPIEAESADPRMEPDQETGISNPPITPNDVNPTPSQSFESQREQDVPKNTDQQIAVPANRGPQLHQITVLMVNSWLDAGRRDILPGMDEVLQELDGRDQLFVIDDSISMQRHKNLLLQTSRALIAMASEVDPDRVEMVFTSNLAKIITDRHPLIGGGPNHMVSKIRRHFGKSNLVNSTNMESKMGQILSRLWYSTKPTSIYIMTDGVWQPSTSPGGGVEDPIRNLVRRLFQNSRNREFITLQFIQFGHDPTGTERLRYLDDDLPKLDDMHN